MHINSRVTPTAVELVKHFEGLRTEAGQLRDGRWMVGYSHTRFARKGVSVTPKDAEALLVYDLSQIADAITPLILTPLRQNQFEALLSFAFNIGLENFRHSTVLTWINQAALLQAAAAIELWRKAEFDGEELVVDALVRRRAFEKAHFLALPEGVTLAPTAVVQPTFDHAVIAAAEAWARTNNGAINLRSSIDSSRPRPEKALLAEHLAEPAPLLAIAGADAISGDMRSPNPFLDPVGPDLMPLSNAPGREAVRPMSIAKLRSLTTDLDGELAGVPAFQTLAQAPDMAPGHERLSIFQRSETYYLLGFLGLMLFVGAVASILNTPSLVNLGAGLVGVLMMAPSAGVFLFRQPPERDTAHHAAG
jgi:lysozyme